jgi:DNA polymerase-1
MTMALIDADILVYECCYRAEEATEWEPGSFTYQASLPDAIEDFTSCINNIMEATGATERIVTLSSEDRSTNFRKQSWPEYKEHRTKAGSRRPLLYHPLRAWIMEEYNARMREGIEADDTLGILATFDTSTLPPMDQRIVCSVDKDMFTIPGFHYNWRKEDDGVIEITEDVAYGYFMVQTLTGDSTDNYPGCPGVGPVKALKILGDLECKDMWTAVKRAFAAKDIDEGGALNQARCARILRAKDWDFENSQPLKWVEARDQWT